MTKDIECYNGWTDVGVFIYFDDEVILDECQECKPPSADAENVIAYYFEVRIKPCWLWLCCYCYEVLNQVLLPHQYSTDSLWVSMWDQSANGITKHTTALYKSWNAPNHRLLWFVWHHWRWHYRPNWITKTYSCGCDQNNQRKIFNCYYWYV